ncbi:MAG: PIN domain-containing protein [Bryobacteraceae bacterium]|jgi:predicted nucleic acid-binding protein
MRNNGVLEDGVLQPLENVQLEERQQVTVTIGDPGMAGQDIAGYFTAEEWAAAGHDDISVDEVRRALSTISGSLSEAVIALRQEPRVADYFLDTSALTKRYHKENGSDYMDRILEQPGSRSVLSNLTIIELESVLALKIRTGEINPESLETARRRFRAILRSDGSWSASPVNEVHFQSARKLLVQYGAVEVLRTLDALQLAVALDLRQIGHIAVLVAADQRLYRVATLAGCSAVNPEQSGPILV